MAKHILFYAGCILAVVGFILTLGIAGSSDTGAITSFIVIVRWALLGAVLMVGGAGLVWYSQR